MSGGQALLRRLDAALLRVFARAMFALARAWLQVSFGLRRAGMLGPDRFWTEMGRAARINRQAVRAATLWLRLTRR